MKTKFLLLLVFSIFLFTPAFANVDAQLISEDSTASTTYVYGKHLMLVNQGTTNEVYFEVAQGGTVSTALATSASGRLDAGESVTLDSDKDFSAISTICDAAETTTVLVVYWD